MKNNETLCFKLAKIGKNELMITLHLHRTSSGYWSFCLRYGLNIDMADRLIQHLADRAGFEEKFNAIFHSTERRGRFYPTAFSCSALYCSGKFFPSRESIVKLITEAFLPCWKYAVDQIISCGAPGDSWAHMVWKAEKQILYSETGHAEKK